MVEIAGLPEPALKAPHLLTSTLCACGVIADKLPRRPATERLLDARAAFDAHAQEGQLGEKGFRQIMAWKAPMQPLIPCGTCW